MSKVMFKDIAIGEWVMCNGNLCRKHSRHTAEVYYGSDTSKLVGRFWFRYRDICEPVARKTREETNA